MKKEFLNIDELIEQFRLSINGDEYEHELEEEFRDHLISSMEIFEDPKSPHYTTDKQLIMDIIQGLAQDLIDSPIETKKQFLIEDKSFMEIKRISNKTFDRAIQTIKSKKVINPEEQEILEGLKKKLKELLTTVKPWNMERAEQLVSESLLELGVIANPNTEFLSLRLGHIYKNYKEREER